MRQWTSLIWKEWRETHIYLWIALGTFLGLPLIASAESVFIDGSHMSLLVTPWVVLLSPLLAIFVAVGSTCRDLPAKLEDFWRSRPLSTRAMFLMKYIVGLSILCLGGAIPLLAELVFSPRKDAAAYLAWMPFVWVAAYTLGFVAGCLVRRTAHAAMLAIVLLLVLYILPFLFPPLRAFVFATDEELTPQPGSWPHLGSMHLLIFGGSVAILAGLLLVLALAAVIRHWQLAAGPRVMYASVSMGLLLLLGSASYQLGTNLPVIQEADLGLVPGKDYLWGFVDNGGSLSAMTENIMASNAAGYIQPAWLRSLKISGKSMSLGEPEKVSSLGPDWYIRWSAPVPNHPFLRYVLESGVLPVRPVELSVVDMRNTPDPTGFVSVPLWTQASDDYPLLYEWRDRLCVLGEHLLVLDIADPLKPIIVSDAPRPLWQYWHSGVAGKDGFSVNLVQVPNMDNQERLKFTLTLNFSNRAYDNGYLVMKSEAGTYFAYRLKELTPERATFELIAEHHVSAVESFLGGDWGKMLLNNGLLYVQTRNNSSIVNSMVLIYDVSGPHPLKLVGHFGAPVITDMQPLPDGRLLVGGNKIYLLGPPPHTD